MRCDCWREGLTRKLLVDARIPRRYLHCDLDTIRPYNDSLKKAVAAGRRFAGEFPVVDRGLLFLGAAGVGKTHIAVGTLKQVIQTCGARGLFYDTRDLLRVIRSTYDPVVRTSEISVLRPVMEAELLVLDDLGAEKTSEWVEETMNLIVNTRYNERRLTIFTSNYSDIPDDTEPNSLLFRIGFRMRSRLHEMCTVVEVDAADYRDSNRPLHATDDDLVTLWKLRSKALPARANKMARATHEPPRRDGRDALGWSGGKAGRT